MSYGRTSFQRGFGRHLIRAQWLLKTGTLRPDRTLPHRDICAAADLLHRGLSDDKVVLIFLFSQFLGWICNQAVRSFKLGFLCGDKVVIICHSSVFSVPTGDTVHFFKPFHRRWHYLCHIAWRPRRFLGWFLFYGYTTFLTQLLLFGNRFWWLLSWLLTILTHLCGVFWIQQRRLELGLTRRLRLIKIR